MWYIQNVSPYNEHIVPPIDDSVTIPFHGKVGPPPLGYYKVGPPPRQGGTPLHANKILQGGTPPTYVGVTMDISWYIHM